MGEFRGSVGGVEATDMTDGEDEQVETAQVETLAERGYVDFFATGDPAVGEFHCGECGYGVIVSRELPRCPMCGGTVWEQAAWSPFTRRSDLSR
jgi:rubrerythrin